MLIQTVAEDKKVVKAPASVAFCSPEKHDVDAQRMANTAGTLRPWSIYECLPISITVVFFWFDNYSLQTI